jgi:Cu(I)/Ag(I) efflux system membrane fusion protein
MTTNQINSLAAAKRTNPVITIVQLTELFKGTESMTTAAGSMQNSHNELFNIERRINKKMKLF